MHATKSSPHTESDRSNIEINISTGIMNASFKIACELQQNNALCHIQNLMSIA